MKAWGPRAYWAALTVCCSCLLAVGGEAPAADLPSGPGLKDGPYFDEPSSWEGFYAGGAVGGGWTTAAVDDHYTYYGDPESRNDMNGSGVTGGGQIGYNFQWGNFVFGPEADFGYLGLSGSRSVRLPPSPTCLANSGMVPCGLDAHYSTSGNPYGDITGRLGYALDRTLFYAKGGVAFLDLDVKANYVGENCSTIRRCPGYPNAPVNFSRFDFEHSDTRWGWTVGGGVEYALSQEWSVKIEYQHFDFGSKSFAHNADYKILGTPQHWHSELRGNAEISQTFDAVKVGVNFHFNASANLE